jgi:acyl-CoA synthetase (AMP-forming)/AMP-acid ligase II/surface polysaccharide O-acyltransferase-like enzyme
MTASLQRTACGPLGWDLAAHGERIAMVTESAEIPYRELAALVASAGARLGSGRRLVLVSGANAVEAIVAYLGGLAAGHCVILAPGENPEPLITHYDPDVVVRPTGDAWAYEERRAGSAHVLHPDLALLLSTSGSTGSPKLVRLSHGNLRANAESIGEYLGIRDTDRAATSLPMHYCYGLSVINSHLARGAGLILTGLSVADPGFWSLFRRAGGTAFAGVPYTFTLLDRIGFDSMRLPALRYVTQAGGRLPPGRVRHYADLGRGNGWDLFVMYGQTEATARMAYLPPDLVHEHPAAIGVPIPGGSIRLDHGDDEHVGEIVYSGPNVMLGYAERAADLALGRTVTELRTGDLARRNAAGLYEIVGRCSRFMKVFGLRIDPDRVESRLADDGVTASCTGGDDELVVAIEQRARADEVRRAVAARCGLPARAVRVVALTELPRLPSGKPDHRAAAALASARTTPPDRSTDLCGVYAEVLDRPDVTPDSSFASLGGDSLSYAEMSVRLEEILGRLPVDWHATPIRDLRAEPPGRWGRMDTSVALRAVSILLVVGSHIGTFTIRGGAAILLAIAGFNFARFHLGDADRPARIRHVGATVARIAVPSMVFIAAVTLLTGSYGWENPLLLNEAFGPRLGPHRHFWFIETLVYILLALLALLALPAVDRWERRWPFGFALAVLAAASTVRFDLVDLSYSDNLTTPATWFWLFALGWAIGKASGTWRRWLVTALVVGAVVGHHDDGLRVALVTAALLLLIWFPRLPTPSGVHRLAGVLAGASLYIYLTHWHVYPHIAHQSAPLSGWAALAASVVAGVVFGAVVDRLIRLGSLNYGRRLFRVEEGHRDAGRRRPDRQRLGLRRRLRRRAHEGR